MQELFTYLLKLSVCLAIGYLFYFLLLRHLTWYAWNRYFLLFFPIFCLVIPLLPVIFPATVTFNAIQFITGEIAPATGVMNTPPAISAGTHWTPLLLATVVMLAGIFFFLLQIIARLISLGNTRSAAIPVDHGHIKLFHLPGCNAPFSFYNDIFLDTARYSTDELEKIIAHELVHIKQKHTVDMLMSELLCAIQWFNPFAWLMKHAIRQNLEFIADDSVLQNGISRKRYQYLLLKVSAGVPYALANNLLFPSLKKRIQMMNRPKTTRVHLLKFMCIAPMVCLLLLGFSGKPGRPAPLAPDAFSIGSLSYYIHDAGVAALVQKEEAKSFLKPGGPLSLALISEEKTRLQSLLERNGYHDPTNHAITFVMDTSATARIFSVQVRIELGQSAISPSRANGLKSIELAGTNKQFAGRSNERRTEYLVTARSQGPPGSTLPSTAR